MSQPDLLLHIGVAKTGTTALQQFLTRQRAALQAQGILYPESPCLPDHPLIALAFEDLAANPTVHMPALLRGLSVPDRVALFFREFEAELAATAAHTNTVLIVAESIYIRLRTPEQIAAMAAYLRPKFRRITVMLYLRRQDQFATSMYSQNLRLGRIRPPSLPQGTGGAPDYNALLAKWEAAFGAENIAPRLYGPGNLINNNVIADFAHAAGIDLTRITDTADARANVSMSQAGQILLVEAGEKMKAEWGTGYGTSSPAWMALVRHADQVCTGKAWRPTQEEAERYASRFAASNEAVRQRYFPDRPSLFSTDFTDLPATAKPTLPAELAQAAIATLISLAREAARLRRRPANAAEP